MNNKNTNIVIAVVAVLVMFFAIAGVVLYLQYDRWQPVEVPVIAETGNPSAGMSSELDMPLPEITPPQGAAQNGEVLDAMPDDDGVLDSMPDGDEEGQSDSAKITINKSDASVSDKDKKEKELEDMLHKEHLEFYRNLFKNPDDLGFVPDAELFKSVYMRIRSSYVDNVSDEKLFDGVVKEIGVLLEAKGLPKDGLKRLDPERNALVQLDEMYGKDFDQRVLYYATIEGMLMGLDDPYTTLMTPSEYGQLQEEVQSKGFGGIGIYIELDRAAGNQITVADPVEGTPADKAGLEVGDQILAIDGEPTKGMALDVATSKIRGPVGSTVVLKIRRQGVKEPFNVSVKRATIHLVSVKGSMLENSVGYVRIRQFGSQTGSEVHKELGKLLGKGAKSIVLDLRNNGGGYVDAAVDVVGEFVPKKSLVVYTEGRVEKRSNYLSQSNPQVKVPVVVLINRFSASASEITAGALRDHKIASIIGEKSFGKGSVQQIFQHNDGSALKMTVALFYSPSGYKINKKGLVPDIVKDMDPRFVGKQQNDIQLQRAIKYLKEGK